MKSWHIGVVISLLWLIVLLWCLHARPTVIVSDTSPHTLHVKITRIEPKEIEVMLVVDPQRIILKAVPDGKDRLMSIGDFYDLSLDKNSFYIRDIPYTLSQIIFVTED